MLADMEKKVLVRGPGLLRDVIPCLMTSLPVTSLQQAERMQYSPLYELRLTALPA